jgi:DNA-binding response OmpR family regulator
MSAGRILIVDDDPQIRRVLKVTLTGQGYEVDDAKSGDSALEKIRDRRFDLVLLDMNMPGMGGLETCRAIREQSETGIIMLTVRDNESDAVAALDAGADDYVTKPFKPSELSARIRAALRRTPSTHGPSGRLVRLKSTSTRDRSARAVATCTSRRRNSSCSDTSSRMRTRCSHIASCCRQSGVLTTEIRSITSG